MKAVRPPAHRSSVIVDMFDGQPAPEARDPIEILRTVFGHASFRGRQSEVVGALMSGRDAVALFPTGAGKSICYQVPALARPGTGIVVSPLIALMRDQVEALKDAGVRAAAWNSSLSAEEADRVRNDLRNGRLDVVYVAPERATGEAFRNVMRGVRVSVIAIDEAHCVSTWGHDFRKEYLDLHKLSEWFPGVPRVALTATADPHTRKDIIDRLGLQNAEVFDTSFDRANISYSIVERGEPKKQLFEFVGQHRGESGIVYCLSRKKVEETAAWLSDRGIKAKAYHAGLDRDLRAANQDAFLKEEGLCLVATVAFGMGIDKPDVRYVAHLDIPSSVEAYYQETGRAGRDGLPSEAWMCYGMADVVQRRRMIDEGQADEAVKRIERAKLGALLAICETAGCRRKAILGHFGEAHPGGCGNCDTCLKPVETWDGTEAAKMALAAIYRTGERFGVAHVIDVLAGKSTEKIRRAGHDKLPVFGVGKDIPASTWQSVYRQLTAAGYIAVDHGAYGALKLDGDCRSVFRGEITIQFRKDRIGKSKAAGRASQTLPVLSGGEARVFDALKAKRSEIARGMNLPPYVVFNDATLTAMAKLRPETLAEFSVLPGVGAAKLEKYGQVFLDVMAEAKVVSG